MTLTELQALSPDELRVRVAELMGWKTRTENWPSEPYKRTAWQMPRTGVWLNSPDNYHESLDRCREFEDAMTDATERLRYCQNLRLFTKTGWPFIAFATPLQKCQAYVLTKQATKTEGAE